MAPESSTPKPSLQSPTTRSNGRRSGARGRRIDRIGDLAALSAASKRFTKTHDRHRSRLVGSSWLIAIVAGLFVGAATGFLFPSASIVTATFRFKNIPSPEQRTLVRKELMDFAWNDGTKQDAAEFGRRDWFVDHPSGRTLRLCLNAKDRSNGIQRARQLAEAFLAHVKKKAADVRSTPTVGERVLAQRASQLEERLQSTQSKLESVRRGEHNGDPTQVRPTLMQGWEEARNQFVDLRKALTEAIAEHDRLASERDPTNGIVATEDRRAALQSDDALQQDLGELTVNLTEAKLHMLNVWQQSAGPLELLQAAATDLAEIHAADVNAVGVTGEMVENLRSTATEYLELLTAFATEWNREFVILRRRPVDPMTGAVLEIHRRSRSRLNDFLFHAGKHLANMRGIVDAVADLTGDQARLHVLHASLVRFFGAVQTAHHRFEFAAGTIDTQNNFKLDIAVRAGRGFLRRTHARIVAIDRILQERAKEQAVKQRAEDLRRSEERLALLRGDAEKAVARLVAIQKDLNINAGLTETYLRSTLQADMSQYQIDVTNADLETTKDTLAELSDRRILALDGTQIELLSVDVIGRTVDVQQRLRIGGLSALVTLLVVGLVQWLMIRRGPRT